MCTHSKSKITTYTLRLSVFYRQNRLITEPVQVESGQFNADLWIVFICFLFQQQLSHNVLHDDRSIRRLSTGGRNYHWRELPQVSLLLSRQKYACRDKTEFCRAFVATKLCFVPTNTCLSRQIILFSRQAYFCRDKNDTYGSSRQWQKIGRLCAQQKDGKSAAPDNNGGALFLVTDDYRSLIAGTEHGFAIAEKSTNMCFCRLDRRLRESGEKRDACVRDQEHAHVT